MSMQRTVWKEFEIKNLREYHDLYVQIDTSLLDDVFETFRSRGIVIFKSYSTFFSTRISMTSSINKSKSAIRTINSH